MPASAPARPSESVSRNMACAMPFLSDTCMHLCTSTCGGGISLSARDAADSLALFCRCLCAGKHTASDGEADCVACGAGKYAATPLSATACVDCAAGKHLASTANDAETDCVACAAGADACLAVL